MGVLTWNGREIICKGKHDQAINVVRKMFRKRYRNLKTGSLSEINIAATGGYCHRTHRTTTAIRQVPRLKIETTDIPHITIHLQHPAPFSSCSSTTCWSFLTAPAGCVKCLVVVGAYCENGGGEGGDFMGGEM